MGQTASHLPLTAAEAQRLQKNVDDRLKAKEQERLEKEAARQEREEVAFQTTLAACKIRIDNSLSKMVEAIEQRFRRQPVSKLISDVCFNSNLPLSKERIIAEILFARLQEFFKTFEERGWWLVIGHPGKLQVSDATVYPSCIIRWKQWYRLGKLNEQRELIFRVYLSPFNDHYIHPRRYSHGVLDAWYQSAKPLRHEATCVICREAPSNILYKVCGHQIVCKTCNDELMRAALKPPYGACCPLCRTPIWWQYSEIAFELSICEVETKNGKKRGKRRS